MPDIILASASASRQKMLQDAGLNFTSIAADIDEKAAQQNENDSARIAEMLAHHKALKISAQHKKALVIGSDQVLECEGQIFSKAKTKDEALKKLQSLAGKTHHLISAVCIAQNNQILWSQSDKASLTMNALDDALLQNYINKAGNPLTTCVGAYAIEQHGAWLFNKITGDYFTILGMPLLPLLNYLRLNHGVSL